MTNYKHTLIGFIIGALLVIFANSFDKVVKVMIMPTLETINLNEGE